MRWRKAGQTLTFRVLLLDFDLQPPKSIVDAYVLLNLGDSVTTDHISPAGTSQETALLLAT